MGESVLTEKQVALRKFYKRRRPKFGKKGKDKTLNRIMKKIEEANKSSKNKTAPDEEDIFTGSESERKMLKRNPSGPAFSVVKPPSDFKLPEDSDEVNEIETNSATNKDKNKKPLQNPP